MKRTVHLLTAVRPIIIQFFLYFIVLFADIAHAISNENAKLRAQSVNTIVLHAISGPICRNDRVVFSGAKGDANRWKEYFEKSAVVGIHYIVDRDGRVASSIDEDRIANHAKGRNSRSLGIELVNNGDGVEDYSSAQIEALINLVRGIMSRHKDISRENIVRHSDVDKRTFRCNGKDVDLKQDPGSKFPFQEFLDKLSLGMENNPDKGKEPDMNKSGSIFANRSKGEKNTGSIFGNTQDGENYSGSIFNNRIDKKDESLFNR